MSEMVYQYLLEKHPLFQFDCWLTFWIPFNEEYIQKVFGEYVLYHNRKDYGESDKSREILINQFIETPQRRGEEYHCNVGEYKTRCKLYTERIKSCLREIEWWSFDPYWYSRETENYKRLGFKLK